VGMLSLTAATMKGYELATGPVAGVSPLTTRWFLVVATEFELILGLCLLVGILPSFTWWVSAEREEAGRSFGRNGQNYRYVGML